MIKGEEREEGIRGRKREDRKEEIKKVGLERKKRLLEVRMRGERRNYDEGRIEERKGERGKRVKEDIEEEIR